ncbi:IclR family transcriptional regulator C-terminal domain-containing protein [Arthrobacter sp. NPDC058130]|uniref:IclR family transcriptional regulator domain-containing protein n=1 Tax=Arthrobacter sp. NPDC058130 TaxID=3346353 RepID=UPI0036EB6CC1
MLADLRPDHLAQMLQRLAVQDADVAALEAQPAQIREFGSALNARPDDITSSAMTVQDPRGTTIAAIDAAGPSIRTAQQGQQQIARQLHAAAVQIEEALRAAPNQ